MDEHEEIGIPAEDVFSDEASDQSRRDFVTKLVTAAGAIAVAGLVSNSAEADTVITRKTNGPDVIETSKTDGTVTTQTIKFDQSGTNQFKFGKFRNGFRVVMSGRELGLALRRYGVLNSDVNLENATITIEFSA
ncbi:MAG: twin-arginine translocation signal domain-containing protein [Armatimonadota bacterium]